MTLAPCLLFSKSYVLLIGGDNTVHYRTAETVLLQRLNTDDGAAGRGTDSIL